MAENNEHANELKINAKFVGIIGLSLGVAGGILTGLSDENERGLGLMIGVAITGIATGFFIYFIITKKELGKNENMFLLGLASGYFSVFFIIKVISLLVP